MIVIYILLIRIHVYKNASDSRKHTFYTYENIYSSDNAIGNNFYISCIIRNRVLSATI